MVIMGIDPGIATTGYSVIYQKDNSLKIKIKGCIKTDSKDSITIRLLNIFNELTSIFEEYKPDIVAIEELFFSKNVKTAIIVGQARGVCILAAAKYKLKVFEYTPLQVKQSVVGYGRAPKEQVQQMTKILFGLKKIPKPDDVADALAVAYCHLTSNKMNRLLRGE